MGNTCSICIIIYYLRCYNIMAYINSRIFVAYFTLYKIKLKAIFNSNIKMKTSLIKKFEIFIFQNASRVCLLLEDAGHWSWRTFAL